jgi:methionyl aminopeptidase
VPVSLSSAKRLHKTIRENFGTIVFCRRYLERLGVEKYLAGVKLQFLAEYRLVGR